MASTIETTCVVLRKGSTDANLAFTGAKAEVVVDLGADNNGTDVNTTLRLHNGIVPGGIPMCRADLLNISTSQLAIGRDKLGLGDEKNLAYADLSNLEASDNIVVKEHIVQTLNEYGIVNTDELDTALAGKANTNMSNVDTVALATGEGETGKHAGKNLAYADTSNINTINLTDTTIHDGEDGNKPLAFADGSNLDTSSTSPLYNKVALKNLTNVTGADFNTALFDTHKDLLNIEQTTNKLSSYFDPVTGELIPNIPATKYPTANAGKEYTDWAIQNSDALQNNFQNAQSFEILSSNYNVKLNTEDSTFYPNNENKYLYLPSNEGVITNVTGFEANKIYPTYYDISTVSNVYSPSDTVVLKELLQVEVTAVDSDGWPTIIKCYQPCSTTSVSATGVEISDENDNTVTFNISSSVSTVDSNFYEYTVTNITHTTGTANFDLGKYRLDNLDQEINKQLYVRVISVTNDNKIDLYEFVPAAGGKAITEQGQSTLLTQVNAYINASTYATVGLNCLDGIQQANQGGGLLKTDLSNLLGMTDSEAQQNVGMPWRLLFDETIPATSSTTINDKYYYTLTTQAQVWEALKTALSNIDTLIDTKISQYALSDTYRGQVLYYLQDNSTINSITTRPSGAYIEVGDMILVQHKTGIVGMRPYLYTCTAVNSSTHVGTWSEAPFVNESSAQSNGDYVYCLDLGTWDTENYHNASGNITWNANVTPGRLDVAPDHDNVPDGVTIVKDTTTSQIALGAMHVPAPEFFSPNGSTSTFTLQNNVTGKIPFDVYVDGVFQYPIQSYTYSQTTKVITFTNNFTPRAGTNSMAVIYRGVVFGSGATAVSAIDDGFSA